MIKNLDKKIRAYALRNAIHYEGKANSGSVVSALFNEGLEKEEVKEIMPKIQKAIEEISKFSSEQREKEFEKLKEFVSERERREGLPELPNVPKTGVVMRFAQAASGPMHLGHALTGMPNSLYVKKYGGKFYIRIEDTNPDKVFKDCYKGFKEDCDWLFGNVAEYIVQSDRIDLYYRYAVALIEKKSAYVCTCSQESFKKFSNEMKECPCRKKSVKENILSWEKMLDKKGYREGEAVLRFKSNMKHPNPAMRDFPLARICEKEHPKQKKKHKVWPLMNLSVTIDDIEYGMTHIIRAKEHLDNAKRQKMIYESLGFKSKFPWTFFMGRYKFTDVPLSKRKIVAAIESGEYEGWDDLRLPTLKALKKKGYKPETFAKFAELRGLTEVDKVIDSKEIFRILNELNKD